MRERKDDGEKVNGASSAKGESKMYQEGSKNVKGGK